MKATLLAVALAIASPFAAALDFEAGAGINIVQPMPNGTWYQEGLPYTLDLRTATWFAGVSGEQSEHWRWHVDYVNLGTMRADAMATTDANYSAASRGCISACPQLTRFIGSGSANGVRITEEWHTTGPTQFGLSAGPYVFQPKWHEDLKNWTPDPLKPGIDVPHDIRAGIEVGAVLGASVRHGPFELRADYYLNRCYNSAETGIWQRMLTLTAGYHF